MGVSRVRPDDRQGLESAAFLFDEYRVHYGHPSRLEASLRWLRSGMERDNLLVYQAFSGEAVAGLAIVSEVPASLLLSKAWQLRDLYVAPAHRRQGIATRLIERVVADARSAGAVRVSLQTELTNSTALRLYSSLGFVPVEDLRLLYKPLGSDDAIA